MQLVSKINPTSWAFYKVLVLLALVLALVFMASLWWGRYTLSLTELWTALWPWASGSSTNELVVWQLRLPRALAAVFIGSGLAVAGAAYQTLFRNPLVSPDILGVSAGAGLGAVLAIFLSLPLLGVQTLAFIGGMLTVAVVYMVSLYSRRYDPLLILVLAGIAISTFLGAGISLIRLWSDPYTQQLSISFWLLGGLHTIQLAALSWAAPLLLVGVLPLWLLRWRINTLSLSELEAQSLGVHTVYLRIAAIFCATLITATAVSLAGIIGWVGLVIPHISRLLVGPEFSRLLPTSALIGAIFLLIADSVARSIGTIEFPLGIITALVGAPFFIYLLLRGNSNEA